MIKTCSRILVYYITYNKGHVKHCCFTRKINPHILQDLILYYSTTLLMRKLNTPFTCTKNNIVAPTSEGGQAPDSSKSLV